MPIEREITPEASKKLYKQIRLTTDALFHKLRPENSKNMRAFDMYELTKEIRSNMEKYKEAFHPSQHDTDLTMDKMEVDLTELAFTIENKFRRELEKELSIESIPTLLQLMDAVNAKERNNKTIINQSISLMIKVNEQNPLERSEEGYIPAQHINRSEKVRDYLQLVHDRLDISEKKHILEFNKLIEESKIKHGETPETK